MINTATTLPLCCLLLALFLFFRCRVFFIPSFFRSSPARPSEQVRSSQHPHYVRHIFRNYKKKNIRHPSPSPRQIDHPHGDNKPKRPQEPQSAPVYTIDGLLGLTAIKQTMSAMASDTYPVLGRWIRSVVPRSEEDARYHAVQHARQPLPRLPDRPRRGL